MGFKIRSIKSWRAVQNRRAWLRIVEAFIAVMIVMTTLLIIVNKQKIYVEQEQQKELAADQEFILEQIRYDPEIKSIILSGDEIAFREKIYPYIPEGYSYSVRICPVNDICSQGDLYVPGEVFSNEIIIASNLTTYNPRLAKVFYWLGEMPEGECFNEDGCKVSGEKKCFDAAYYKECGNFDDDDCLELGPATACAPTEICMNGNCVTPQAILEAGYTNLRKNYGTNPGCTTSENWYYYDLTIRETSGTASATLESRKRCYYWTEGTIPKQRCDSSNNVVSPPMSSANIPAGGMITASNRWFCIIRGYNYNVIESFYTSPNGINKIIDYTINGVS